MAPCVFQILRIGLQAVVANTEGAAPSNHSNLKGELKEKTADMRTCCCPQS